MGDLVVVEAHLDVLVKAVRALVVEQAKPVLVSTVMAGAVMYATWSDGSVCAYKERSWVFHSRIPRPTADKAG